MTDNSLQCPSCGYILQQLTVATNSGGKFDVDHCGRCGGTWFDPYEINRIPYHEVMRLAHMTVLPQTPPPMSDFKKCPHCNLVLSQSTTDLVPAGVELLRCPKCHGVWASQKALSTFKHKQDEAVKEYKSKGMAFPSLAVVFVPAIFTLLLFFSTFVTINRLQDQKDNRTQAEALVNNVNISVISPTDAGISFKTNKPLKSKISYGPSTIEFTEQQLALQPTQIHAGFLRDLKPDTVYIYQITVSGNSGETFTTNPQSFRTNK